MTRLDYLNDTYAFSGKATATSIESREDQCVITLDATLFYPQGGGQPADQGRITTHSSEFIVHDVRMQPDGIVYHYGTFTSGSLTPGEEVTLHVEEERRVLHARLHSAGHLLDMAVAEALGTNIVPTKGHHFPDSPYVEYEGQVTVEDHHPRALEEVLQRLIAAQLPVHTSLISAEEAEERGVWAPPGKPARVMHFQGQEPGGCGGTHVRHSGEIGPVTVRKISSKKGKTRVSYTLTS